MPSTRPPSSDPERHLPLKPVDFHVLLVLVEGPLHGYGMVREIRTRSQGRIRLEAGNLYRYLRRLVDTGLVSPAERLPRDGDGDTSERRRYYRLTRLGRSVLAAEAARMRALVAAAEERLATGGSGR